MRFGGCVDLADAFDQPGFVHGSHLFQHDLAGLPLESNRHTGGVWAALCGHGGDDDGIDMVVHFVRGNDEAGAGLADFTAFGWIETHEKDVEPGGYHVQFFRSH